MFRVAAVSAVLKSMLPPVLKETSNLLAAAAHRVRHFIFKKSETFWAITLRAHQERRLLRGTAAPSRFFPDRFYTTCHFQLRISGMSSPYLLMYWRCSNNLS